MMWIKTFVDKDFYLTYRVKKKKTIKTTTRTKKERRKEI